MLKYNKKVHATQSKLSAVKSLALVHFTLSPCMFLKHLIFHLKDKILYWRWGMQGWYSVVYICKLQTYHRS